MTGSKKLIIALLEVTALLLAPVGAWSTPSQPGAPANQFFVTTEPVPTASGPAHVEVKVYEIADEATLANVESEVAQTFMQEPPSGDVFRATVHAASDEGLRASAQLENSVQASVDRIFASVSSPNKRSLRQFALAVNGKALVQRHYNLVLSVVRVVANTATVSTGLIVSLGIPPEHALIVGALAGGLSGAIQLKSDSFMKWLENATIFVAAAKKMGLLPAEEGAENSKAQKFFTGFLHESEMYGRWAMLEAAFLLTLQTSMALLNIPIHENLFLTVAKSTASQGVFEIGVLSASKQLEDINPRWAGHASTFKNVSLFGGSVISVIAAVGALVDMPFANLGFVTLTGAGLVLTLGPRVMKTKPVAKIIEGWQLRNGIAPKSSAKSSAGALTCSALFAR